MPGLDKVRVICFPSDDGAFRRVVEQHVCGATDDGEDIGADRTVRKVEGLIRAAYPDAVVRPMDPFAMLDANGAQTLYCFRDGTLGRIGRPNDDGPRSFMSQPI